MDKIEVKILNPEVIREAEKMMVCCARLTQKGHGIKNMDDFLNLYNKSYKDSTVQNMTHLPHPTIQKFGVINIVVVGASRRFLAQITRHQNEIKFMSASCQYSDYSGNADFVVPYDILGDSRAEKAYFNACHEAQEHYENAIKAGISHDDSAYMLPQGLRNILVMSATPYQWKHMIGQRTCNRNTKETQYVMLKCWEALYNEAPEFFSPDTTGPFCMRGPCKEGKMSCGRPLAKELTPTDILQQEFPKIYIKNTVNTEMKYES